MLDNWDAIVERGARRLAEMNLDGLPDWQSDLSEDTRAHWRFEFSEALRCAFNLDGRNY